MVYRTGGGRRRPARNVSPPTVSFPFAPSPILSRQKLYRLGLDPQTESGIACVWLWLMARQPFRKQISNVNEEKGFSPPLSSKVFLLSRVTIYIIRIREISFFIVKFLCRRKKEKIWRELESKRLDCTTLCYKGNGLADNNNWRNNPRLDIKEGKEEF